MDFIKKINSELKYKTLNELHLKTEGFMMKKQKNIRVLPLKKIIILDPKEKYPPKEGIYLRVDDVGGGPFLVMKCVDLEPTDEYDADEITFELDDWNDIDTAVRNFIKEIIQLA